MTVWLLWRNNEDDYYTKDHDLKGVFWSKELAAARQKEIAPDRPIDPENRHSITFMPSGDWYETEEIEVQ